VSDGTPFVTHRAAIAAASGRVLAGIVIVVLHAPDALTGARRSIVSVVEVTDT
jgi:hypothetical protein